VPRDEWDALVREIATRENMKAEGERVRGMGGLHIIGTERHEARRIDNQLRGRAGRQGDPGSSRFYVSLEDELMRRFGSERIGGLMERLGMEEDVPIEHGIITKSIENAQVKVEGHNFDLRKHVVQYDDVMNRHREVIYEIRKNIVSGDDQQERIWQMVEGEIDRMIASHLPEGRGLDADVEGLYESYSGLVPMTAVTEDEIAERAEDREALEEYLLTDASHCYDQVEAKFGPDIMRRVERQVLLTIIDKLWVEHLGDMDELREGVNLQAYGQKDPLVVYKTEGYRMFGELQGAIAGIVSFTAIVVPFTMTHLFSWATASRPAFPGASFLAAAVALAVGAARSGGGSTSPC